MLPCFVPRWLRRLAPGRVDGLPPLADPARPRPPCALALCSLPRNGPASRRSWVLQWPLIGRGRPPRPASAVTRYPCESFHLSHGFLDAGSPRGGPALTTPTDGLKWLSAGLANAHPNRPQIRDVPAPGSDFPDLHGRDPRLFRSLFKDTVFSAARPLAAWWVGAGRTGAPCIRPVRRRRSSPAPLPACAGGSAGSSRSASWGDRPRTRFPAGRHGRTAVCAHAAEVPQPARGSPRTLG